MHQALTHEKNPKTQISGLQLSFTYTIIYKYIGTLVAEA